MIGIILDIIIVAVIVINVYFSYKKGLVNLAVGMIAFIVSIIIALVLCKPISNLIIEKTQIDETIENAIVESFSVDLSKGQQAEYTTMLSYLENYVGDAIGNAQNQMVTDTAATLAVKVINIGVMIGLYIIARIALVVLTLVAGAITSLPILKQINEAGGIVYGIIKSLIIIYVILAIVFFLVTVTANATISTAIDSTYITKFFYNNNILLNILF